MCLYGDLVVLLATALSAVWHSMCYTRSACTGDSAATGVVTSSFFVIMAANGAAMYFFYSLRPSSFVASFVGHRPIFWGTCFSLSVLYLTTTVCKQRAANREGHQRGETSPAVHTRETRQCSALKWLCRETTPKGACEGLDRLSPEVGHLENVEAVSSQNHFVRHLMFTPVGEHPSGY